MIDLSNKRKELSLQRRAKRMKSRRGCDDKVMNFVVYKNVDSDNDYHYGKLLTSLDKIQTALYLDVSPYGHIATNELDWKKLLISPVDAKDIISIIQAKDDDGCREILLKNYPAWFF